MEIINGLFYKNYRYWANKELDKTAINTNADLQILQKTLNAISIWSFHMPVKIKVLTWSS